MKKKVSITVTPNIEFDFENESLYMAARRTGIIDDYKMARIERIHESGFFIDYPCHSKECMLYQINKWGEDETVTHLRVYPSTHYYDVREYD